MRIDISAPPEEGHHILVSVEGPAPWRSVLLTRSGGELRAYWNVCRHLPVPLDGGVGRLPPGDRFVCLTHGASFRLDDGMCESGPCAGAALHALACGEGDDGAWVDLEIP